ncbi:hypothetical protein ACA910_007162 [Epithemia clementina (nom. ined.)]
MLIQQEGRFDGKQEQGSCKGGKAAHPLWRHALQKGLIGVVVVPSQGRLAVQDAQGKHDGGVQATQGRQTGGKYRQGRDQGAGTAREEWIRRCVQDGKGGRSG